MPRHFQEMYARRTEFHLVSSEVNSMKVVACLFRTVLVQESDDWLRDCFKQLAPSKSEKAISLNANTIDLAGKDEDTQ